VVGELCVDRRKLSCVGGVLVLPEGEGGSDRVAEFLRRFLSGHGEAAGQVGVVSECGGRARVRFGERGFEGEGWAASHEVVMAALGIDVDKRARLMAYEESVVLDADEASQIVGAAVVETALETLREVVNFRVGARRVFAPGWLIALALRVAVGEKVVVVRPGRLYVAETVQMLMNRDVQAFVVTREERVGKLAVAVVDWR
jgi:hypothetical protein